MDYMRAPISRRRFLKSTAAGLSTIAMPEVAPAQLATQMPPKHATADEFSVTAPVSLEVNPRPIPSFDTPAPPPSRFGGSRGVGAAGGGAAHAKCTRVGEARLVGATGTTARGRGEPRRRGGAGPGLLLSGFLGGALRPGAVSRSPPHIKLPRNPRVPRL